MKATVLITRPNLFDLEFLPIKMGLECVKAFDLLVFYGYLILPADKDSW